MVICKVAAPFPFMKFLVMVITITNDFGFWPVNLIREGMQFVKRVEFGSILVRVSYKCALDAITLVVKDHVNPVDAIGQYLGQVGPLKVSAR